MEQHCSEKINNAVCLGFETLLKRHIDHFSEKFDRVCLNLCEERVVDDARVFINRYREEKEVRTEVLIELLFHFGRYFMISGSAPGTQAMTLQGIWNKDLFAPWRSNYTVNINTKMNYWLAEVYNMPEYRTAKELYGCRGSLAHHNIDLWRKTTPGAGHACWGVWPMSLGWLIYKNVEVTNSLRCCVAVATIWLDIAYFQVGLIRDFIIKKSS